MERILDNSTNRDFHTLAFNNYRNSFPKENFSFGRYLLHSVWSSIVSFFLSPCSLFLLLLPRIRTKKPWWMRPECSLHLTVSEKDNLLATVSIGDYLEFWFPLMRMGKPVLFLLSFKADFNYRTIFFQSLTNTNWERTSTKHVIS